MKLRHLIQVGVVLATLLLIISNSSAQMVEPQANVFDVFPLKSNLHYTYDYYYEYSVSEVAYLMQLKVDSGLVEYIVHDSVMVNDSTIIWNLEERQYLWHRRLDNYIWLDSIYFTFDTIFLPLYENIYRNYELTSSGIVWNFPITTPPQAIYRYADSSSLILIGIWNEHGSDTLQFSDELGYFHRHRTWYWDGISHLSSDLHIELQGNPTNIVQQQITIPTNVTLSQNYPNPFNPSTQIIYTVPKTTDVKLKIYDLLGREVATLVNERKPAGTYTVNWNAEGSPSGIYFYRFVAGEFVETKKLAVVK